MEDLLGISFIVGVNGVDANFTLYPMDVEVYFYISNKLGSVYKGKDPKKHKLTAKEQQAISDAWFNILKTCKAKLAKCIKIDGFEYNSKKIKIDTIFNNAIFNTLAMALLTKLIEISSPTEIEIKN